ncbi:MAG: MerR family transcriptional regulator [Lachnospiraceae bacterium]|nr:MerR family transcriptional regulator [Lachnospiraceae bacterium]
MMTVKEISDVTGISVRTLHYYDEIDLLKPSQKSDAGYRLYDDKALETLQQILFFREFDIPLKEIKAIIKNPTLDKNQILQMQRNMLVTKKKRMERLIASIDDILKGENKMDFEVFTKTELENMIDSIIANMNEKQRAVFTEHYGTVDAWREHFLKNASTEAVQKKFQKIIEWYGSKEEALDAATSQKPSGLFPAYQKRLGTILQKLAKMKGQDVTSFEVKELIGEYDFVSKQMYQMKDVTAMMIELAEEYQTNRDIQKAQDSVYGEGATKFIGRAITAFYSDSVS